MAAVEPPIEGHLSLKDTLSYYMALISIRAGRNSRNGETAEAVGNDLQIDLRPSLYY